MLNYSFTFNNKISYFKSVTGNSSAIAKAFI